MVSSAYYDTIIERLRERLGDRAENLITLCFDANGLDYESSKRRERNREEEPYVGDMIANTVYAIITAIDGRHQAELEELREEARTYAPHVEWITPGAFDKAVGGGVDVPVTLNWGPVIGTAHVTKEEEQ